MDIEERVQKLEDTFQNLMDTIKTAEDDHNYSVGLEEFKGRNTDKLDKYDKLMRKFNGDDFDIYKASYDEYNTSFNDIEEDTYIAKLIEKIEEKIAIIQSAVNEGDIEAATEAAQEAKDAAEEATEAMEEHGDEHADEAEEEAKEAEEIADEADEIADEDLAEFQKELDEDYEAMKASEK